MQKFVTPVLLVALFAGSAFSQTTFTASTIDANSAGDDKALVDILGNGKKCPVIGGPYLIWYDSNNNFAKYTIRSTPLMNEFTTDMQSGDIDGDGDIDLIIADRDGGNSTGTVYWVENPRINPPSGHTSDVHLGSNWVFHTVGTQGAVIHDMEIADLDNDGKLDIVTSGHGVTTLWKQNTPTSWTQRNFSGGFYGSGIFIGDVDGDGWKDFATPSGWIKNPHNIIAGTWINYVVNGAANDGDECGLADLNGDGKIDLLVCNAHSRNNFVWYQQPAVPTSATWTRRVIDSSIGSHKIEFADFNGDGKTDILMGLENQELSVYVSSGSNPPTFVKIQLDNRAAHNARIGDINGDGKPDIFGCDYIGNPPARVYINQTTFPSPCYANCDGSTTPPVLTANDFQCFLNQYAANDSAANCDGSTIVPVLTANDFQCFLNKYAAGCS